MSKTKAIAIEVPIIMAELRPWWDELADAGGPRGYFLSGFIDDGEMISSALYITLSSYEIGAWPKSAEPDIIFYTQIDSWIRVKSDFDSVICPLLRV